QKVSQPILEDTTTSNLISPSILECLASKNFQFDDPETKTHVITHQLEIPLRCELLFLDYEASEFEACISRNAAGTIELKHAKHHRAVQLPVTLKVHQSAIR
ncbi:hypothetical protein CSKR_202501, partial [Clonorchis sinensis]